jgi:hypothetical protein
MTLDLFVRVAQPLHAIDTFDSLLVQSFQSIADLESQETQVLRTRARIPRASKNIAT